MKVFEQVVIILSSLLIGFIFGVFYDIYYQSRLDNQTNIRVLNLSPKGEEIIFEGNDKFVNIERSTQDKPNDLCRVMIFDTDMKCRYRRLFKSKYIEVQYL
jgi:hypothetical protein